MLSSLNDRYQRLAVSAMVLIWAVAVLTPDVAQGCAVCWGSSEDQPLSRGIYWAILFLMAMPFTIVGSIGGWLAYKYRHSSKAEGQRPATDRALPTTQLIQKESGN
ncbi:MAG TPA: hypothetical protein VFF86_09470 [Candidatus Methylomirabilis sp.]|nr:hypothetical protein [Candidatus Methylomirabilis sp.]